MPGSTPNRGYPYPLYSETQDFPAQMQALALAVDTDVKNNLEDPIALALDQPSVRIVRDASSQAIAANVNVTLTYNLEIYDNDGMADVFVNNTTITINTPGIYLISGAVRIDADTTAGGAAALILMSSGAFTNPVGISRSLDNDKNTSLSYTTLHRVPTAGETLTQFVRHNHALALPALGANFSATRIT